MKLKNIRKLLVVLFILIQASCHEQQTYVVSNYPDSFVPSNDFDLIYFDFIPLTTYRLVLHSISGDADIAIYNSRGDEIVYSDQYGDVDDEVIFTADDDVFEIEIYGYFDSEYQLIIEELSDHAIGLNTSTDGLEFNVSVNALTGTAHTLLAASSVQISHIYEYLTIRPNIDFEWLDVNPVGTLYNRNVNLHVGILEAHNPSFRNYASIRITSEDNRGMVSVFKDVDIYFNLVNM